MKGVVTKNLLLQYLTRCSLGKWHFQFRSSHRRCSITKGVLKNFAIFTGKYMRWNLVGISTNGGFCQLLSTNWFLLKTVKVPLKYQKIIIGHTCVGCSQLKLVKKLPYLSFPIYLDVSGSRYFVLKLSLGYYWCSHKFGNTSKPLLMALGYSIVWNINTDLRQ